MQIGISFRTLSSHVSCAPCTHCEASTRLKLHTHTKLRLFCRLEPSCPKPIKAKSHFWGILILLTWSVTTKIIGLLSIGCIFATWIRCIFVSHSHCWRILLPRLLSRRRLKHILKHFWPEWKTFHDKDCLFNHHTWVLINSALQISVAVTFVGEVQVTDVSLFAY